MNKKRKILFGIAIFIILLIILNFKNLSYLSNFVYDELRLVAKSEDLSVAIKNPKIDSNIREQLVSVPEVNSFGDSLGFPKTKAYSKYAPLDREVFQWTLSGARKDSFEEYFWSFPIVGRLPYKGFTRLQDANNEEQMLKDKGYDTYLGKSSALSTLGILSDPIITTMIDENDSTELIETIYHERTHQFFFKKDHVTFNENSAEFLGSLATIEFTKQKFGVNSTEYNKALNKYEDMILFSEFINGFYGDLSDLYAKNISYEEKLSSRESVFKSDMAKYELLKINLTISFKKFDEKDINNAYILSQYRYHGKIYLFNKVYEKLGQNLTKTMQFFNRTAHSEQEPDAIIKAYVSS